MRIYLSNLISIHYESEFETDLEEDNRHHHHHPHRTRDIHYNDKLYRVESRKRVCGEKNSKNTAVDVWICHLRCPI